VTNHASATNADAATDEPLRPVADPVLLSSHLAAFEAPHERKTEMLPRKLCHGDVGKVGIVDTENCKLNAIDPSKIFELWRVCPPLGVIDPVRARSMTPRQDRGIGVRVCDASFVCRLDCSCVLQKRSMFSEVMSYCNFIF
jgi:hypothetical protein